MLPAQPISPRTGSSLSMPPTILDLDSEHHLASRVELNVRAILMYKQVRATCIPWGHRPRSNCPASRIRISFTLVGGRSRRRVPCMCSGCTTERTRVPWTMLHISESLTSQAFLDGGSCRRGTRSRTVSICKISCTRTTSAGRTGMLPMCVDGGAQAVRWPSDSISRHDPCTSGMGIACREHYQYRCSC